MSAFVKDFNVSFKGFSFKYRMEKAVGLSTVEDTVQYQLFLLSHKLENPDHHQEILQQYIERILAHFAATLVSYIWQNQPFNLKYKPAKGKDTAFVFLLFLCF